MKYYLVKLLSNAEKTYMYATEYTSLEIGDSVLVPTLDTFSVGEIVELVSDPLPILEKIELAGHSIKYIVQKLDFSEYKRITAQNI